MDSNNKVDQPLECDFCPDCECWNGTHLFSCATLVNFKGKTRNTGMAVNDFGGKYRFLSNFYPCKVVLDGIMYNSTEQAYQAAKTLDPVLRKEIQEAETFNKAKRLGSRVALRSDWEEVKLGVMQDLLEQKFAPGTGLREKLDATAPQKLTEGNYWHDNFYGSCICDKCKNKPHRNELGKLLMLIRDSG